MSEKQELPSLTLENWSDYVLEDISEDDMNEDERTWNRYVVMKQAEINTMMRSLPNLRMNRIGTLCSATGDGGCDPLDD